MKTRIEKLESAISVAREKRTRLLRGFPWTNIDTGFDRLDIASDRVLELENTLREEMAASK